MGEEFTEAELEAYLEESLDPDRAAQLEQAMTGDPSLLGRMSRINSRRDAGIHTLGEIWRRNQVGVPTREEMANFLLGVLPEEHAGYIQYRIETLRCPYTIALHKDLMQQQTASEGQTETRRKKYFHSSAGLLKRPE